MACGALPRLLPCACTINILQAPPNPHPPQPSGATTCDSPSTDGIATPSSPPTDPPSACINGKSPYSAPGSPCMDGKSPRAADQRSLLSSEGLSKGPGPQALHGKFVMSPGTSVVVSHVSLSLPQDYPRRPARRSDNTGEHTAKQGRSDAHEEAATAAAYQGAEELKGAGQSGRDARLGAKTPTLKR